MESVYRLALKAAHDVADSRDVRVKLEKTMQGVTPVADRRAAMLSLKEGGVGPGYVPAAFFLHFGEGALLGPAAVERHIEYFRFTGMDFVKVQYERKYPLRPELRAPADWADMPRYGLDFYRPQLEVVDALVKALGQEALVLVTLYSPYMCAGHTVGRAALADQVNADAPAVEQGLDTIAASLLEFIRECRNLGVDGFYASTQGGEAGTLRDPELFEHHVKPSDLRLQHAIADAFAFNILHVCDYAGPYADLRTYADYPGHVVSCGHRLSGGSVSMRQLAEFFGRPVMGGMDRAGALATGTPDEVRAEAAAVLRDAPDRFVLGADCTIPGAGRWEAIRAAVAAAHAWPDR